MKKKSEKETYKYLGILEADTIKEAEMKLFHLCFFHGVRLKNSISREPENYSKSNFRVDISWKE